MEQAKFLIRDINRYDACKSLELITIYHAQDIEKLRDEYLDIVSPNRKRGSFVAGIKELASVMGDKKALDKIQRAEMVNNLLKRFGSN